MKVLLWTILIALTSFAQARDEKVISPSEAIQKAKQKRNGKVLGEPELTPGKNPKYRVKIIHNGQVETVEVEAEQ